MSCPAAKRAKLEIGGEETTPSLEEDSSFPGDGEGEESSPWCHSEKGVGITEFRSDTPGFFGILKRRYVCEEGHLLPGAAADTTQGDTSTVWHCPPS